MNRNTQNKWMIKIHQKGWTGVEVANRWNISRRHLGNIISKPPGWLSDAVAGLPYKERE